MKAGIRRTGRRNGYNASIMWVYLDRREFPTASDCRRRIRSAIMPRTHSAWTYEPPCIRRVGNRILIKQSFHVTNPFMDR